MCLLLRLRPAVPAGKGLEIFLLLHLFGFFSLLLALCYVLHFPPSVTPVPPQRMVALLGVTGGPLCHCHHHTALSKFPCHHPAGESALPLSLQDIQRDTVGSGRGPGGFWGLRTPWGGQEPPSPSSGRAFVPSTQPTGTVLCPGSALRSHGHSPWVLATPRGAPTIPPWGGCHPPLLRSVRCRSPALGAAAPIPPAAPTAAHPGHPLHSRPPDPLWLGGDPPSCHP